LSIRTDLPSTKVGLNYYQDIQRLRVGDSQNGRLHVSEFEPRNVCFLNYIAGSVTFIGQYWLGLGTWTYRYVK